MRFCNGLKSFLLVVLMAASYATGWSCHNWAQQRSHRRDVAEGQELRSQLSAQLKSRVELERLKNEQEASHWERAEHRKRIDFAKAAISGIDGYAFPNEGRE